MKSLNTVIEVLEACQNDAIECFECPMRHETECEVKSVALAYLKEYQKMVSMPLTTRLIDVLREVRGEK